MNATPHFTALRVAVVVPVPINGEQGGAERFHQRLVDALNAEQGITAELVGIAADESCWDAAQETMLRFYDLDLSAYDAVISTKSPAYLLRHPNHVCYLQHTMRVFYDMWDAEFPSPSGDTRTQRERVFDLDRAALRPPWTRKLFTIGEEVRQRLLQHIGVDSEVIHQALGNEQYRCRSAEPYLLLPGRLHRWKRVDLAIRAMRYVKSPVRLLILGTGEDEASLRALAGDDSRIVFRGRVSDEELIELYARALAVAFVPVREDFGLITLEAFASGKPVITCADAGEPARIVEDGVTGFVCEPSPQRIAERLDFLWEHPEKAVEMGRKGQEKQRDFTWEKVTRQLLGALRNGRNVEACSGGGMERQRKLKVAVIDMQPITPAVGGGRQRLLGLYHNLGDNIETVYVGTYDWPGESFRDHRPMPGLREICVPLSEAHHAAAKASAARMNGRVVIDLEFADQAVLSPEYLAVARREIALADVVVFSHPWCYPPLRDALRPAQLLVYDSQNVEAFLRTSLHDDLPQASKLLERVAQIEYELCRNADLVLTCSHEDSSTYTRLFDLTPCKLRVVPNGAFTARFEGAEVADRAAGRKALGLPSTQDVAVFLGSLYGPNVDAARFIAGDLAKSCPQIFFVIAGGVGGALAGEPTQPNVLVTGQLEDARRDSFLLAADVALNPMEAGSGTNIKMFDYMAAGLPVLSTAIGARGIAGKASAPDGIVLDNMDGFPTRLPEVLADIATRPEIRRNVRETVLARYSWERLSSELGILLRRVHADQVTGGGQPRLTVALLSTWNIACGIGEHTSHLADALTDAGCKVLILANESDGHQTLGFERELHYSVVRAWTWDNRHWCDTRLDVNGLQRVLDLARPDLLMLQHHSGFLPPIDTEKAVRLADAQRMPVLIEMHDGRNVAAECKQAWLDRGACLVAHHTDALKDLDGANKQTAHVLPLPVQVVACANGVRPNIGSGPILAGFGFLRPHKGVVSAIGVVAELRKRFPSVRYHGWHAIYPGGESEQHLRDCFLEAERLGVRDAIEIDTQFHDVTHLVAELSNADVILMPYEPSEEDASAAVNLALLARRPVVVSPSAIFRSVSPAVVTTNGYDLQHYVDAITQLLHSEHQVAALAKRAEAWVEQNAYPRAARRILEIAGFELPG